MTNRTEAPERGVLGTDGIFRSFDEHYDTMREVEQDPYGAWLAIQSLTNLHQEEIAAEYKRGYWDGIVWGNKDAIAALEKVKREAWNAAIDEVADIIEGEYFEDGLADKIRALKREA